MSTMYDEVASALARLRIALKRQNHRPEDVAVCMPLDTIRAIDASMPVEKARATAGAERWQIVGITLRANEIRSAEIYELEGKVRDLQRRLKRREERDRACSVGMAQIMNAVPIADAVGAGENVQTLVDYVIGKMRPDLGERPVKSAEEALEERGEVVRIRERLIDGKYDWQIVSIRPERITTIQSFGPGKDGELAALAALHSKEADRCHTNHGGLKDV